MRQLILKLICLLFLFFPLSGFAAQSPTQTEQFSTLQVLFEKDSQGLPIPKIIDAQGVKKNFNLDSLIDAAAKSWLNGPTNPKSIDPNTLFLIKIYKEGNDFNSYLETTDGKAEALNLGNILASSAIYYPGCNAQQINKQKTTVTFTFDEDKDGHIRTYIINSKGIKQPLNFSIFLREITLILNQCKK